MDTKSSILSFRTYPFHDEEEMALKIAVYGDLGYKNATSLNRLKDASLSNEYDYFFHVG